MIKKCRKEDQEPGKPWCLYSHDGTKLLGRHPTKEKAYDQEKAIQVNKHGGSLLLKVANYIER